MSTLTPETIQFYLPILKEIQAELDVRLQHPEAINRRAKMDYYSLTHKHDAYRVAEALDIIKSWITPLGFTVESLYIIKPINSDWSLLFDTLTQKINEFDIKSTIATGLIVLTLKHGIVSRKNGDLELTCDFEEESQRIKILHTLRDGKFIDNKILKTIVGAASIESLAETIRTMNTALRVQLELPADKNVIEVKRGHGARINPDWYRLMISR